MIQLYNIDCMEYMSTCTDKQFDLCVTDPPYGVGLEYNSYNDTLDNWQCLMYKFIPEIKRCCQMVIMASGGPDKLKWIYNNYPPDWIIVWHKGSPGHLSYIGFNDYELLLVYGKIKGLQMHDFFSLNNSVKMGDYNHPCPKPIKWFKMFYAKISNNVNVNSIFDPFLGSGTSAIAAYDGGFDFVGCEIDKDYFDAAKRRFEMHKAQLRIEL